MTPLNIPPPQVLREMREGLGLSQNELADALAIGKNGAKHIRHWEKDPDYHPTNAVMQSLRYLIALQAVYRLGQRGAPPDYQHWLAFHELVAHTASKSLPEFMR